MELLRIKAYQPFVCYRKPFSYGFWDTFPLPPFSTILGWVHWVIGAEEALPMNIGVTGVFDSITYDLQTLVKFDRIRKERSQTILDGFNKALSSSPTYVANVTDIHLRIYLEMDKSHLDTFKEKVFTVNYPSLGRYEDLLRVDDVKYIQPKTISVGDTFSVSNPIYLKPETANQTGIIGSNFQIPFYHELKDNLRFFQKEQVVYCDSGSMEIDEDHLELLVDFEKDDFFKNPTLIELFGTYDAA